MEAPDRRRFAWFATASKLLRTSGVFRLGLSSPPPASLVPGVLFVACAVVAAPTRWISRSTKRPASFEDAIRPVPVSPWLAILVSAGLLLISLQYFPREVGTALLFFLSPLGAVVGGAGVWLLAGLGEDVRSLQRVDCALYRIAIAGAGGAFVLGTCDLARPKPEGWPLLPCLALLVFSIVVARSAARRNGIRNAFVDRVVAGKEGLELRPLLWGFSSLPHVGAGAPTHVAGRPVKADDVEVGYRGLIPSDRGITPIARLCLPESAMQQTSPRAALAWTLVGCAVFVTLLAS